MKRTWTIIGVNDVPGSLKWYQALFGQPAMLPAHDYFGQILDSDGTVLLCLHEWGAHERSMTSTWRSKGQQTREFSLRDPDGYYVTISAFSAA
jgi:hypothetical protein